MIKKVKLFYQPDTVSPPGDTLLDLLEERGMTQAELAERTGRPHKTINEIITGKAMIMPETAIQLERVLGAPAEFWNQREAHYRAFLARQKELDNLSKSKDWLKQFPLKEMIKRNWVQDCKSHVADQMIAVLNFFGVATPEQWENGWTKRRLAFRKAMNLKSDIGAISVWLRQGEIEGEKIQCAPFDKKMLAISFHEIRMLTRENNPKIFIPKLKDILAKSGVATVFVKPFKNVPVYGASCWLNSSKALIQLSLRGKTTDKLWFTIFHELGHILKHSKKELFIDIDNKLTRKSPEETEADEFASETLIPSEKLEGWIKKCPSFNAKQLIDFANEIGISPGIVVGRLQHMQHLQHSKLNNLKTKCDWDYLLATQ